MIETSSLIQWLGAIAIGIVSGIVSGLVGVTPGGVLVPLLSIALGTTQLQTQGISLAAQLLPTSLAGFREYHRAGHASSIRAVAYVSMGFLVGTYAGALFAHTVADVTLRWMFVAYLLVLAGVIALRKPESTRESSSITAHRETSAMALIVVGLFAGASSGFLGIGGGLAMIALLTVWRSFTQHQAQALSLAVSALPLSIPAVVVYSNKGSGLPWASVALVVVGLWIGNAIGGKFAVRMRPKTLRASFLVLVLAMAVAMAQRAAQ